MNFDRLLLQAALAAATALPFAASRAADEDRAQLSYATLMKMPFEARFERIEKLPEAERDAFLAALAGERKAVLLVDPDDCGAQARLKRLAWTKGEPGGGALAQAAQDVGHSFATGVLDFAVPGLGSALGTGAKLNELNKLRDYVDVCDMTPEDKAALLAPEADPSPPKKEKSFLDKASRFFAR